MPDLHRSPWRCGWVVAQHHILPHQCGFTLIDDAVEAHGAVLLDLAVDFEEEDLVEVQGKVREAHLIGVTCPALQGSFPVEPTMGGAMVFALDPGPEPAVERLEAAGVLGCEAC